jgi:hypothetical protein
MTNILSYRLFNATRGTKPQWLTPNVINEGIYFTSDNRGKNPYMTIDWNNDTPDDVVKLADPIRLNPVGLGSLKSAYAGYALENPTINGVEVKKHFAEWSKDEGSLSDDELKQLIEYTYPEELKQQNIRILFAMGSGSTLSVRIAEALKELFYPKAKIIDIMKAYYGIDPEDTVDWDIVKQHHDEFRKKHGREDETRIKGVQSYLNKARGHDPKKGEFEYKNIEDFDDLDAMDKYLVDLEAEQNRLDAIERDKFKGYIKKGGTVQSGIIRDKFLKPGHYIDSYIINSIKQEIIKHDENRKHLTPNMATKLNPKFLTVDDVIVKGSTIRRAMSIVREEISRPNSGLSRSQREQAITSMYGYVLFSYSSMFKRRRDQD